MFTGLEYRQLEFNFLMYLRTFGIHAGRVHYDGQVMWVTQ